MDANAGVVKGEGVKHRVNITESKASLSI